MATIIMTRDETDRQRDKIRIVSFIYEYINISNTLKTYIPSLEKNGELRPSYPRFIGYQTDTYISNEVRY